MFFWVQFSTFQLPLPIVLQLFELVMKGRTGLTILLGLAISSVAFKLYNRIVMKYIVNYGDTKVNVNYDDTIANIFQQFPQGMGFSTERSSNIPKKIFLIGDSLVELSFDPLNNFPFGSALAHAFRRRSDVLNRGLSGYSTKWMGSQFEKIKNELLKLGPDQVFMVFVLIGTNDSILPGNPHHVPLLDFEKGLFTFIQAIVSLCPSAAILLATPPPCSVKMLNAPDSKLSKSGRARSVEVISEYASAVRKVVNDLDNPLVKLVDLFTALTTSPNPVEKFLSDGVHLNGDGYRVLFVELFNVLDSLKGMVLPLPITEPHFSEHIQ